MYTFTSMVRYSETDETGYISLLSLMNYLQDCCLFHSESLGLGPDYLKKRHRRWLLSGWQIEIDRYPKMFEKISVETVPYAFSGCMGWRNVRILDEEGASIVRANSPWVYLNTDTGMPERPDETERSLYGTEEKIPMNYAPRKIRLPENMCSMEPVPVIQEFIDTNHHVNNARYVEIAMNLMETNRAQSLKRRFFAREIRVEYKKQAVLGDKLYPRTGQQDEWNYVVLEDEAGNIYASVAFR